MAKKEKKRKTRSYLICEACETHAPLNSTSCPECGGKNFLPDFVHKRKVITKNFSINAVDSFDSTSKVLNFYKWFPGRRWSLNVNTQSDWLQIKKVVDNDLGPYIGWDTKDKLDKVLTDAVRAAKKADFSHAESAKKIPQFLLEITDKIDFSKVDSASQKHVFDGLKTLVEIASKYDTGFQATFNHVLKKLPKEGKVALAQLEELMEKWSLKQITGVAAVVQERLNEIERFKAAISNDKTFEIKGDSSIHRILERSMWIVDERYWLMHSNETLRKFIGDKLSKKDKKKYGRKRPDFVCGSVDNKLIILELKRPSHELTEEDLQQLETYLMISEDYSDKYSTYEAYLVGKKINPELRRRMKFRKSNFKLLTFADLLDNTEERYKNYIDLIKKKK